MSKEKKIEDPKKIFFLSPKPKMSITFIIIMDKNDNAVSAYMEHNSTIKARCIEKYPTYISGNDYTAAGHFHQIETTETYISFHEPLEEDSEMNTIYTLFYYGDDVCSNAWLQVEDGDDTYSTDNFTIKIYKL